MAYQLPESVFKPGNLVHGTNIILNYKYRSLVDLGLMTPLGIEARTKEKTLSLSPDFISFAMLSKTPIPYSYLRAVHYGPKRPDRTVLGINIGIIIDREALLKAFPGQVFAIGDNFLKARDRFMQKTLDPRWYDISKDPLSVFGILVKTEMWPRYQDEVRLVPSSPLEAAVSTNFWAAIVVAEDDLESLKYVASIGEKPPKLDVPVFSTEGKLLSETVDMRKKRRK